MKEIIVNPEAVEKIDNSVRSVQNSLAYIVGNTNATGSTLAVGQFVYVKGHSTIAEGLRKVTASISANGSITTSNTTDCSEGGLNALNSKFAKTLWSSSTPFISGTIQVPNFRDYNVYLLSFSDSITMLATRDTSNYVLWGSTTIGSYNSSDTETGACRYGQNNATTLAISATNRGYYYQGSTNYDGLTNGLKKIVGLL